MAGGRPAASRSLDDPARAIGEFEQGHARVLDLNAFVGEQSRARRHCDHGTGDIEELIDRVNALVHQRAAAIESPGAAPSAGIVVILRAPPFDVSGGRGDFAKAPCLAGMVKRLNRWLETSVQNRSERFSRRFRHCHHVIDAFCGDLQWFFANDMLACAEGGKRGIEMSARRRADGDDVELGISEKFVEIGVSAAAKFGRELFGLFCPVAVDRVER